MQKLNKLVIIGHFGGNKEFLDGQTVKTKILYQELQKKGIKIRKIDTYYKSKRPLKLLLETFIGLLFNKNIIILLSGNGMRFYFPILYFFAKFFGKYIYHDVIGGNLHEYAKKDIRFIKYLNSFKVNWVETNKMKIELEKYNINNSVVLPNFKRLNIIGKKEIIRKKDDNYYFCTFSRVMKEKGISDAIETIVKLNKKGYKCNLNIYGPVDNNYNEEFNILIKKYKKYVKYLGKINYSKSSETLNKYDTLLFPTYWNGEGFPGTIIDAFSAGLPVIATDWNSNSEIITNYVNGIVYPNKNEKNLEEAIIKVIKDKELLFKMKNNSLKEASRYIPDKHIEKIIDFINKNN